MVQYILTPWRDRRELLKVRHQFYPDPPAATATEPAPTDAAASSSSTSVALPLPVPQQQQQQSSSSDAAAAVARVSMWMQRGNCPHMVESTALLTAAILSDSESSGSAAIYAVRAAYAAAFSRFVTGLLDGHQDKQRKLSMYSVAKTIGLPATFVELRHQATHEQLPSLAKLRSAARKALVWIWEYYWRQLGAGDDDEEHDFRGADAAGDGYREAVLGYLEETDIARRTQRRKLLGSLDESRILLTLEHIMDASPSNAVLLASLRLSKEMLKREQDQEEDLNKDLEQVKQEIARSRQALASEAAKAAAASDGPGEQQEQGSGSGWAKYEGTWKPRPIGVA